MKITVHRHKNLNDTFRKPSTTDGDGNQLKRYEIFCNILRVKHCHSLKWKFYTVNQSINQSVSQASTLT